MSKLRVLGARLIVKLDKEEERKSAIIIVNDQKEPKCEGKVVAVGEGTRLQDGTLIPVAVNVGEHVIVSKMAGAPLQHGDDDLLVINERDIIAVVEE